MTLSKKVKKISLVEYQTLAEFRYALREFFHFSEQAAEKLGLTPRQHQALLAIKGVVAEGKHLTIGDLAQRLQIRHHSAVGLINRLIKQRFLYRKPASLDRRQVEVFLTSRGANLLEQLSGVHRNEIRRIGPQLSRLLKQLSK